MAEEAAECGAGAGAGAGGVGAVFWGDSLHAWKGLYTLYTLHRWNSLHTLQAGNTLYTLHTWNTLHAGNILHTLDAGKIHRLADTVTDARHNSGTTFRARRAWRRRQVPVDAVHGLTLGRGRPLTFRLWEG